MTNIIEISHLTKRFGDITAADGLSFTVSEGELFAFLGQNGAGKNTSISAICGRLSPPPAAMLRYAEPTQAKPPMPQRRRSAWFSRAHF